ncbi:MAG: hypothetical protein WC229_00175 [Candidatus Paceibacterota bacterium]|jgi:hypothetical protein
MSQKLIQDILVTKKSIRMVKKDGAFPSSIKNDDKSYLEKIKKNQQKEKAKIISIKLEKEGEFDYEEEIKPEKVTKNSQTFLWVLSVLSLGVLFFLVSSNFSTATINITPRSESVVLDDVFAATSKQGVTGLSFEVITIKKASAKDLDTDGEENVERKSIGKAVVYNSYSTASQRLITNTRLESTNSLVYRIRDSVDIPGYKIVDGKKVPGSVEVEIIADAAGDKYNMKIADLKGDFKIPGFKGSPKYDGFYARLSADTTGGLIGKIKKVSETKLAVEKENLDKVLSEDLIKELYQKKPDQYEIFKDNYFISYKNIPDTELNSDKYVLTEEGTINALMFKKDSLANFIAKQKIKDFSGDPAELLWADDSVVSIISTNPEPWTEDSIKVKFSGDVRIVWSYDSKALSEYLVGQNKSIIDDLVNDKFKTSIKSLSAIIRPQWKKTFPENPNRVKLFDTIRNKEVIN